MSALEKKKKSQLAIIISRNRYSNSALLRQNPGKKLVRAKPDRFCSSARCRQKKIRIRGTKVSMVAITDREHVPRMMH